MGGAERYEETDVVIVGGGPVGMLIAAELAGFGVRAVVFESLAKTSDQPKAGTLHARTVQSLVRRGYLPDEREKAWARTGADAGRSEAFHFAGLPVLRISVPEGEPTPILKRPQADLEREFEARARERGVRVLRGYRVVGVRQLPDSVEVTAEADGEVLACGGAYLVGADGARSTVRRELGFEADTSPASVAGMMGLVRFPEPHAVPPGWRATERGWTVARVGAEGMGLIRTLDPSAPHQDRAAAPTVEELSREASRIAGREIVMADPVHVTRFSDYTRLVRRYRDGRVFLAGDAAHVHFPIGGQGLSTGLLDGVNLAWKLAHAVRGAAGKELLDTYEAERRPAAQSVIDNTRAQLSLMRGDSELLPLREVVSSLLSLEQANQQISGMISGQDTVYPARSIPCSEWEGSFLPNLSLTVDRAEATETDVVALLQDGCSLLLRSPDDTSAAQAREWADVVRTVTVRSGLPCDALLLRPDGYVAWAADGGCLTEALRYWFGEPGIP